MGRPQGKQVVTREHAVQMCRSPGKLNLTQSITQTV